VRSPTPKGGARLMEGWNTLS